MASGVRSSKRDGNHFRYPSPFLVAGLRSFSFVASKLFWSIKFRGVENIPEPGSGGLVVVSNHASYFDPAWISLRLTKWRLRYVAWDETFNWPLIGSAIRHLGAFPVKLRSGPAKSTIVEALRSLKNGAALVIFPEGEREFSNGKLLDFKTGAVHIALNARVPILPVTIRGGNRVWPQGQKYPRFFRPIEVIYHPVLQTQERPKDLELDSFLEKLNSEIKETIQSAL